VAKPVKRWLGRKRSAETNVANAKTKIVDNVPTQKGVSLQMGALPNALLIHLQKCAQGDERAPVATPDDGWSAEWAYDRLGVRYGVFKVWRLAEPDNKISFGRDEFCAECNWRSIPPRITSEPAATAAEPGPEPASALEPESLALEDVPIALIRYLALRLRGEQQVLTPGALAEWAWECDVEGAKVAAVRIFRKENPERDCIIDRATLLARAGGFTAMPAPATAPTPAPAPPLFLAEIPFELLRYIADRLRGKRGGSVQGLNEWTLNYQVPSIDTSMANVEAVTIARKDAPERTCTVERAALLAHVDTIVPDNVVMHALALLRGKVTVPSPGESTWRVLSTSATYDTPSVVFVAPDGRRTEVTRLEVWCRATGTPREFLAKLAKELATPAFELRHPKCRVSCDPRTFRESERFTLTSGGLQLQVTRAEVLAYTPPDDDAYAAHDVHTAQDPAPETMPAVAPAPLTLDSAATPPTPVSQEVPMSRDPMTVMSVLATGFEDANAAKWRTAGSQFVKLTREPLIALLSRHLGPADESLRARIATFLETELGTAMLAALLSAGISALPTVGGDVQSLLARELRVRAMADAGDILADLLMGPLRQVMALYIADVGGAAEPKTPGALSDGATVAPAIPRMPVAEDAR